jgi:hypothetical protein
VLLVAPSEVVYAQRKYELAAEHFEVPSFVSGSAGRVVRGRPTLHLLSASTLSKPQGTQLLADLAPDLIVVNAGVFHTPSARNVRLIRYVCQNGLVMLQDTNGTEVRT